MKRILSIILCIVLISALTACGGNPDTSADTSSVGSEAVSSVSASSAAASSRVVSAVQKDKPVRILPMGDSLTQGGQHEPPVSAYRGFLGEMLDGDGVEYVFTGAHDWSGESITNYQLMHSGYGGADVNYLAEELPKIENRDPDIVLLMVGRNDNTGGNYGEPLAQKIYDKLVKPMLDMFPDVTVYVASVPPIRDYGGGEWIDEGDRAQVYTNPAIKKMVEEHKKAGERVEFVDMGIEATGLVWQDFTAEDFVHPQADGYKKIAEQWHNAIKDKVAEISKQING